ncbi:hypothetical protein ON010_g18261 [Phytophthora cinnamomi]|nr:hypothetical protein ON010_g18261 [Phytophthora cinnamomi]
MALIFVTACEGLADFGESTPVVKFVLLNNNGMLRSSGATAPAEDDPDEEEKATITAGFSKLTTLQGES